MNLNEYQRFAVGSRVVPNLTREFFFLGLGGETGECLEIAKKVLRDGNGEWGHEYRQRLLKELGDLLWYLANVAQNAGFSLDDVAIANVLKLELRMANGTVRGSGDAR